MYNTTINNNFAFDITIYANGETVIPANGGSQRFTDWGTAYGVVEGLGNIFFLDLGDEKLANFTNSNIPWTNNNWGGLVRFQGLEAYFRYEGQGEVIATLDNLGSLSLDFPQGGMMVSIPDLTVTEQVAAAGE